MKFSGEIAITAPRTAVYDKLCDARFFAERCDMRFRAILILSLCVNLFLGVSLYLSQREVLELEEEVTRILEVLVDRGVAHVGDLVGGKCVHIGRGRALPVERAERCPGRRQRHAHRRGQAPCQCQ